MTHYARCEWNPMAERWTVHDTEAAAFAAPAASGAVLDVMLLADAPQYVERRHGPGALPTFREHFPDVFNQES